MSSTSSCLLPISQVGFFPINIWGFSFCNCRSPKAFLVGHVGCNTIFGLFRSADCLCYEVEDAIWNCSVVQTSFNCTEDVFMVVILKNLRQHVVFPMFCSIAVCIFYLPMHFLESDVIFPVPSLYLC